jgi:hypothetical protein
MAYISQRGAYWQVDTSAPRYGYEIEPRPSNLGGAWRLRLLEGDTEVAGGVLADAHADPPSGMEWRNIGM